MATGKAFKRLFMTTCAVAMTCGANASSVTISSVTQRWPWNNKVDITYTIQGGQTRAAGVYCGLRFALTANGHTYGFDGSSIGASAEDGTHTVTWTVPQGIVATDASLTATLFSTNVPSGTDYMIVDLDSGAVIYEGLFATQAESNSRYNSDTFKTTKLVLRKIPRWSDRDALPNAATLSSLTGYPTGDDVHYATIPSGGNASQLNSRKDWPTDRDFYIGLFPVTQVQYAKVGADYTPASSFSSSSKCPVRYIGWDDLRVSGTAPTSSVPVVSSSGTGTFFQRLGYLTGNRFTFDLPTEVMFEIAERAGATTAYFWGDTFNGDYVVYSGNSNNNPADVGSRLPNDWGFYDTAGNVWEWCRDGAAWADLASRPNAFDVYFDTASGYRRYRGGGKYNSASDSIGFHASRRALSTSVRDPDIGFRVALVVK